MVLPDILSRPAVGRVTALIGSFGLQAHAMAWSSFGLIFHPTCHRKPRRRRWLRRRFISSRGSWSRDGFLGLAFWSMRARRPNDAHSVDAPIAPLFQIVHHWRRATDAPRWPFRIPTGFRPPAQGCEERAMLGSGP